MEHKVFLNKNNSKRSVNVDNKLTVNLSTSERLLPFSDLTHTIDGYEVYKNEKDKSTKYRLIVTINPLCSNSLFNYVSEVMYKEGSDEIKVVPLNDGFDLSNNGSTNDSYGVGKPVNKELLTTKQAIRDTEYSHPEIGPYTYHCGVDIFNNHLLRSQTFKMVSYRLNNNIEEEIDPFNTIRDYTRLNDGTVLTENIIGSNITDGTGDFGDIIINKSPEKNIHLYQHSNLLSFYDSYINNINEENGWFGFINKSNIDIINYIEGNKKLSINKVMNNNKACEQIDLYPDRSLYSFTPKINKYRNRVEYNWKYFLTYPYKNLTVTNKENINSLNGGLISFLYYKNEILTQKTGIKIAKQYAYINDSGNKSIMFISPIKHNLNINSYVKLFYSKNGWNNMYCINNILKVKRIGDLNGKNENYYFSISTDDLSDLLPNDVINNIEQYYFRFCNVINNNDSEYYFRIFKKLPNFKFSKLNIYESNVNVDDNIINDNIIPFESTLNKLAFAKNIYSDDISQIVFTDDINIDKLNDNLGRPLSEIYLTIIKNNKGYEKWYEEDIYNDESIEFSHAFGKITSGLIVNSNYKRDESSFLMEDENKFYNVKKLTNVNSPDYVDYFGNIDKSTPIEDEITENGGVSNNEFYGDICEYNNSTCNETIIEEIYHRFNTAQRETNNKKYQNIYYDEMIYDDYEIMDENNKISNFQVDEKIWNEYEENGVKKYYPANINPEGYYYKPHYQIKLKEYSSQISQANNDIIQGSFKSLNNEICFTTKYVYYLNVNDTIICVNKNNEEYSIKEYKIHKMDGLKNFYLKKDEFINSNTIFIKKNTLSPSYARLLTDGTFRSVWKEIVLPSQLPSTSDLYDITFTNNAFYLHKNINFYLKRQDPFCENGLNLSTNNFSIKGNKKDITNFEYIKEENNTIC